MKNQDCSPLPNSSERSDKVANVRRRRGAEIKILIVGKSDFTKVEAVMREWLAPLLADRFLAEHFPRSPVRGD